MCNDLRVLPPVCHENRFYRQLAGDSRGCGSRSRAPLVLRRSGFSTAKLTLKLSMGEERVYPFGMAELHFEVSGTGNIPLICVHGWGCEGGQFLELNRLLAGEFRIYRPDLPGHGRTPLGGFVPNFKPYADVLVDFIREHQLERPVLLGHSMGGVLA